MEDVTRRALKRENARMQVLLDAARVVFEEGVVDGEYRVGRIHESWLKATKEALSHPVPRSPGPFEREMAEAN